MTICGHTGWLRIWRCGDDHYLETSDRPHRLLGGVRHHEVGIPGLLVLIGNQKKQLALSRLRIADARLSKRRSHGEIHLFLSSLKSSRGASIIIADGDLPRHKRLPTTSRSSQCHELGREKLGPIKSGNAVEELADRVYHRSVFPLADLVCIFVDDVGGIHNALRHIASWDASGPASTPLLRPWVLLIVSKEDERSSRVALNKYMRGQRITTVATGCFQEVSIACFPGYTPRSSRCRTQIAATWTTLRQNVLKAMENARIARQKARLLFSACHVAEFLCHGALAATKAQWTSFDFVKASRRYTPVATDLESHITNVITLFNSAFISEKVAMPLIASSFVLDHYTPQMHLFDPRAVFKSLFKQICVEIENKALKGKDNKLRGKLPSQFAHRMEEEMIRRFDNFLELRSAKQAHRELLLGCRSHLARISSEDTCLSCMRRRPRTGLHCIHSTCGVCARLFGSRNNQGSRASEIDSCVLCGTRMYGLIIREPPKTAKLRVLSFEGGGMRGIGPIMILIQLEKCIRLSLPVVQNFDICYATSCGAGIMLRLCDGWDIQSCVAYFMSSAKQAFEPRSILGYFRRIPCLYRAVEAALTLLYDSKYPSNNLDALLQNEYGPRRSIMDHSRADEMGIKYGLTLTTADKTETVVASSYNAVGSERQSPDYGMLRPSGGMRNIPLWQIVRCAMAAPYYFSSRYIDGVGTLQDGGLSFNNPSPIAVQEVAALYPARPEPSTVVSVSTGSSETQGGSSFIHRVFQAFWRQADSTVAWKRLLSRTNVGSNTEYFRFDFQLDGKAPRLDAVDKMEAVGKAARQAVEGSTTMTELASHLRAQLFYFELDEGAMPLFKRGSFSWDGFICCRLDAETATADEFFGQLEAAGAALEIMGRSIPISRTTMTTRGGELRQKVHIRVSSRGDPFEISLREKPGQSCSISGSPFTLEWLIKQQNLEAVFGTEEHENRKRKAHCKERQTGVKRRKL